MHLTPTQPIPDRRRPWRRRAIVGAAAAIGTVGLGLAAPATADDATGTEPAHHPDLDARCNAAIDQRLDHLTRAQATVDDARVVTDAHEATIDAIIDATRSGLTQLAEQIDAAPDPASLVQLCATIGPDYRVYLVVLPQTHLTVGADRAQVAAEVGYSVIDQLDEAIAAAQAAGIDVSEAEALRDVSLGHLEAADTANDGVADAVLAVTPAGYNDGDGATVLDHARTDLREAHAQLERANETGLAAAAALREALG